MLNYLVDRFPRERWRSRTGRSTKSWGSIHVVFDSNAGLGLKYLTSSAIWLVQWNNENACVRNRWLDVYCANNLDQELQ